MYKKKLILGDLASIAKHKKVNMEIHNQKEMLVAL